VFWIPPSRHNRSGFCEPRKHNGFRVEFLPVWSRGNRHAPKAVLCCQLECAIALQG
jgi:hypothetical protein